jgi:hypothetical protein
MFVLFVYLFATPTQYMSHGTRTAQMTLADLRSHILKATPGVKTTSPARSKRCIDSSCLNPFNQCYDHAGIKGDCISYVSISEGNPFFRRG